MEYMWKHEEKINEKFYPPRSKICKEDSNSNTPSSALNFSTFSTYLENNPMRRYFVPSPGQKKVSPEINKNESPKFSSPEIINLKNANCQNKNSITPDIISIRKGNSEPKSAGRYSETVRNTYLNMNVNMNVMNSPSCFVDKSGQTENDSTARKNVRNNTTMNLIPTDLFLVTDSGHSLSNLYMNSEFFDDDKDYSLNRFNHVKPQSHSHSSKSLGSILHQNIPNQIGGMSKFSHNPNLSGNNLSSPPYLNKGMPSGPVTIPRMPVQGLAMYQRNCMTPQNNEIYYGYMNNNMMINNGGEYYCNNSPFSQGMNQSQSFTANVNTNFNPNYGNQINASLNPNVNMNPNIPHINQNGNATLHNMNPNINIKMSHNMNTNANIPPSFTSYARKNSYTNVTQPLSNPQIPNGVSGRTDSRPGSFPRSSSPNYMTMDSKSLAKQAYVLARDQAGCRYLQKKIEDEPEIANALIYPNIIENITELIKDPFGNYLVQKLFNYLSEDKFYQLLAIVSCLD